MRALCEESHPERPEVLCDKEKPCYSYHSNGEHHMTWGDRPIPGDQDPDPGRLLRLALRIRRYEKS